MSESTELDEAAIRARLEAATPGPWIADIRFDGRAWIDMPGVDGHALSLHGFGLDAEFVAHARTDVERLLAALDEARAAVLDADVQRGARCFHGAPRGCLSYRCGSNCGQRFDRMHPCPACLIAERRDAEARAEAAERERDEARAEAERAVAAWQEDRSLAESATAEVERLQETVDDLRSRLACVLEASYWDRGYDERIAAIRGMCDLTQNGFTPADDGDQTDRTRVLAVPNEDALLDFLTALNVSGLHPEVPCSTPGGGMAFLAGLTEPDADHVHITVTDADSGVVHCCECSHPGERPNQWDPNSWKPTYPVLALVTEGPDMERVADEDFIDPWWAPALATPTTPEEGTHHRIAEQCTLDGCRAVHVPEGVHVDIEDEWGVVEVAGKRVMVYAAHEETQP